MSETKEFKQYRKKTCPHCGSSQINWTIIEPEKDCNGDVAPNFVVEEKCCNCEEVIKTTELYGDNTILETVNESDSNPDTYKEAWQKLSDNYAILEAKYEALVNEYHESEEHYKQLLNSIYGSKSPLLYDENDGIGICESDDEKTIDYEAVIKTKDSHIEELATKCDDLEWKKETWRCKYVSLVEDVEWLIHKLRTGDE